MQTLVAFTVHGVAQPAGSKKAFQNRHTGRIVVTDDAKKSRPWKTDVTATAAAHMNGRAILDGPLTLAVIIHMPRPKGHYGARGLRPSAPTWPAVKPDATKLLRAVEDALTGVVWRDDAQVVQQAVVKRYADDGPARVDIAVYPADQVAIHLAPTTTLRLATGDAA